MSCHCTMLLPRLSQRGLLRLIGGTIGWLSVAIAASGIALSQQSSANSEVLLSAETLSRPTLKSGSKGAEVAELQATLKLLGYYDGTVDGIYDMRTLTAVSRFQQAAGLPADGIVGDATWNRLFPPASALPAAPPNSTAFPTPAPVQSAPTSGQPPDPTPAAIPNQPSDNAEAALPILRIGMTGSAVTALQERLQAIGMFDGAVDGVFGAETQAAVKTAQRNFSLEPDGVVGAETWSVLLRHTK